MRRARLRPFIASLQKLNLLTEGKQGRRAAPKFRMPLPLPGTAISVDRGYARPAVKTCSMKQMARLVDRARILKIFCDLQRMRAMRWGKPTLQAKVELPNDEATELTPEARVALAAMSRADEYAAQTLTDALASR